MRPRSHAMYDLESPPLPQAGPRPFSLLAPKLQTARNFVRSTDWKGLATAAAIAILVALAMYGLGWKLLTRIDSVAIIGPLLKRYLLSMVLFSLMMMLVFSNVITSLSTFYGSRELDVIFASPVRYWKVFVAKYIETLVVSSWMVFALLSTLLIAYGRTYESPGYFYLFFWLPLVPFCMFSTSAGIAVSLLLARVLPVQQTRNILRFMSAVAIGVLVLILRMMRPEQLMRQDKFKSFTEFLYSLHNPQMELFPSAWTANTLLETMGLDISGAGAAAAKLYLGAALSLAFTYVLASKIHFKGWLKFQESSDRGRKGNLQTLGVVDRLLARLSVPARSIVEKDIKVFVRSPVLWTQFLLMLVIVAIYIYNIYLLPLKDLTAIHPAFPDLLSFLNIGFVAFIVVACALRFGYPAVSMEGTVFYRIHASPISLKKYLWIKYWMNFVPLLAIALVLVVASNKLLGVRKIVFALSLMDGMLVAMAVSALAIAFGAYYRNFNSENFAQIPSGFGGMMFMVACLAFVVVFLSLQAYPMYLYAIYGYYLMWRLGTMESALAVLGLASSLGLSMFLLLYPMQKSADILRLLEERSG